MESTTATITNNDNNNSNNNNSNMFWNRNAGTLKNIKDGLPMIILMFASIYGGMELMDIRLMKRKLEREKITGEEAKKVLGNITGTPESDEEALARLPSNEDWDNVRGPRFDEPETLEQLRADAIRRNAERDRRRKEFKQLQIEQAKRDGRL